MISLQSDDARRAIGEAVGTIEKKTAAELVVALQPKSGDYVRADLAFGAIAALAAVCGFLYSPEPFDYTFFPLEQAAAFILGAALCAYSPPLRRLLVPRRVRRDNVVRAARAMFLERGIDRTRARTGILVYLSAFEREVALVADRGVAASLDETYAVAERELTVALKKGSLEQFLVTFHALGEKLGAAYPAGDDDIDELSNEVAA